MNKQYLLLSAALLLSGAAHAQGTELFFSEYDEGAHQSGVNYGGATNSTGSERALEIYNPTTSTVNLNPYSVRRYSNGSATPTEEERLFRSDANQVSTGPNTMVPRSTFVLASGEASLPIIRTRANQFSVGHAPTTGPTVITGGGTVYFNGDDAMALVRYPSGTAGTGPGVIIDIIGVIGYQPGPSSSGGTGNWSGFNPVDDDNSTTPPTHVYVLSANQSLVRRPNVSAGVRNNPAQASYNIATEWMMYSTAFNGAGGTSNPGGQLYDQLGQHNDYPSTGPFGTYQTTISGTLEKFNANISVYPNPAHGTATVEIKDAKVGSVMVMNNLGQRIGAQAKGAGQEKLQLDVSALKPGLYFVQIWSADGQTKIYKELVVQ
ncbi:T9SS type A sorting domain-containing protein [Hymenobacter convexus]|uniref:T9SS type A sorting domain-containing protein n=1 Tax=Hymenobacter sp. CA1UV-4 TaxID=3063782 RepID=UPI002713D3E6|nr:T9SS type A sorting domain-containing protein [Hymenobacter sp. CA1UV-4]MDO7851268.1 T9SS type A sorting domain-containing protein [Hymenobacter sp. CA1UV-4]